MDIQLGTAVLSALVAIFIAIISWRHNKQVLKEQKRAEKRKVIQSRLNDFYGPLVSYLNVIKALYQIFRTNKPKGFRTLTYLLNPDQEYKTESGPRKVVLSQTDHDLLKEIIEIEIKVEDLIISKSGLIDDETLMFDYIPDPNITDVNLGEVSLIATAIAHFRILRMAYNGHFKNEAKRFENFVYPRELDFKLKNKISDLQTELVSMD